jgi:type VI secretion system protein ImpB
MSSIHNDLERIQPPYVHIRYDVEVGGAIQKRELPFVVLVMSDLSGASRDKLPKLKSRPVVDLSRENFDSVMAGIGPTVRFAVPNRMVDGGDDLRVNLQFSSMDDFGPDRVAQNLAKSVPQFGRLLELRRRISTLLATMDGNDDVESMIARLISDQAALKQLCHDAGRASPGPQEGQS